jgi:cytochrome c oxidase cbb3-type subunit 3
MVDVMSRQSQALPRLSATARRRVDGRKSTVQSLVILWMILCSVVMWAQGRGGVASFPAQQRDPADPAIVEKGRAIYDTECRSCHGPDLRGGERGGPNLLRLQVVLNDREGEMILPIVQGPHKERLSPAGLSADDVRILATYIHSVLALAPGQGAPPPGPPVVLNVLVGNAAAGEKYFAANCASCHSVTGDLRGIGARSPNPVQLQNLWIAGGAARGRGAAPLAGKRPPPMTTRREAVAVVTLPSGQKFEGRLERIDDFLVALTEADGTPRSFRRDGDAPKVEVRDPLEAHRKLLPVYTDKDIHDVTAYLAGLK